MGNTTRRFLKVRALTVLFLVLACGGLASGRQHVPLPVDLDGTLNGVAYKIRVPAIWNGTLLVFAHGTQLGPSAAEAAPIASPPVTPSLEDQLLALGYALAGSGFANSDKEGVQHTLALTNFFRGHVGEPRRIIVWGNSLGARITLKLIEKHPGIYDAAVANCSPSAGTPENMDSALAFSLAYAAAFGWHDDEWGPVGDLRDDLKLARDVAPLVVWPSPATYGRWEFIRLVMQVPPQAFWGTDPQTGSPFFGMQMWKATEARAASEAENGGPVAENVGMQYALSPDQKAYLSSLGVEADQLLDYMNARANITADNAARRHSEHWGAFSGDLRRPVLTMHAKYDGLTFVSNESHYAHLVQASGSTDRLVQAYVNTVGHCSFSAEQYKSVVAAVDSWLDTGVRPDEVLLPPGQGFDLMYVPPLWVF